MNAALIKVIPVQPPHLKLILSLGDGSHETKVSLWMNARQSIMISWLQSFQQTFFSKDNFKLASLITAANPNLTDTNWYIQFALHFRKKRRGEMLLLAFPLMTFFLLTAEQQESTREFVNRTYANAMWYFAWGVSVSFSAPLVWFIRSDVEETLASIELPVFASAADSTTA